jgi:hypothetical protein
MRLVHSARLGELALGGLAFLLIIDFLVSQAIPNSSFLTECCTVNDMAGDLIAASGVAVAFVLTYLAALTGLTSPGRQLLSSVLSELQKSNPGLAIHDEDARMEVGDFEQLEDSFDEMRHYDDVGSDEVRKRLDASCDLLLVVVGLAKPPHVRPTPTVAELRKLGYSDVRAWFMCRFVFKRDAERRVLLQAAVLTAAVFFYTIICRCLESVGVLHYSVILPLGFPILASIGFLFGVALALRMWPHDVDAIVIEPLKAPLARKLQRDIANATSVLGSVAEIVREKSAAQPPATTSSQVSEQQINESNTPPPREVVR